jgi:hypothetical protein
MNWDLDGHVNSYREIQKMNKIVLLITMIALASGLCIAQQTSAFNYQGKLGDTGSPANGTYQFQFKLFDASSGGGQLGTTQSASAVVTNGIFTTQLDFGSAVFIIGHGIGERWLEISVRPGSTGAYTTLTPRRQINSVPLAVGSLSADDAVHLGGLSAGNYVQTTDPRLFDARTPTAGSVDYIHNQQPLKVFQPGNFAIDGIGFADILSAVTEFDIQSTRVLGLGASSDDLFVGTGAGLGTTGSNNTLVGNFAGRFTSSGNYNSFFGDHAGITNDTGSANTLIGEEADVTASNLSNATAIGWRSNVSQSNSLVLGGFDTAGLIPFNTRVGIGTSAPSFSLHVIDPSNTGLRVQTNTAGGTVASFGGKGSFQIDAPGIVGGRFIITESGNVGINTNNPLNKLDVAGIVAVGSLGSAGSTTLCRNASNQISTCSSSLRYKTNIKPFGNGLNIIDRLKPITFSWKDGGMKDVGFGAEDVARISPLLVTYNQKGEVEGVKYDRLSVLFVNAFKEQQLQLDRKNAEIRKLLYENAALNERVSRIERMLKVSKTATPKRPVIKRSRLRRVNR